MVEDGYELVFSHAGETPDAVALLDLLPGCAGWLCAALGFEGFQDLKLARGMAFGVSGTQPVLDTPKHVAP